MLTAIIIYLTFSRLKTAIARAISAFVALANALLDATIITLNYNSLNLVTSYSVTIYDVTFAVFYSLIIVFDNFSEMIRSD